MCLHKNVYAASASAACMCVWVCCLSCVYVCALTLAFLHVCLANYALRTNKSGSLSLRAALEHFSVQLMTTALVELVALVAAALGALWELRLSRLPGCLFFNAPQSLSFYAACVASCSFCFSLRAGNNNCNMALPPLAAAAAQLQQEASHEDISEIQRARQSVARCNPQHNPT